MESAIGTASAASTQSPYFKILTTSKHGFSTAISTVSTSATGTYNDVVYAGTVATIRSHMDRVFTPAPSTSTTAVVGSPAASGTDQKHLNVM
jgi:hypothetical protein